MANTLLISAFIGLSFRPKYGVSFSYYGNILLFVRQSIRLLDFEDTKTKMDITAWHLLCVQQLVLVASFVPVNALLFGNVRYNKIYLIFCSTFSIICGRIGFETDNAKLIVTYNILIIVPIVVFLIISIKYFDRNTPKLLKLLIQNYNLTRKFK